MKLITILLSSALTLLLITSSNASAAAYIKFDGIQAQQPNMNSGGRFMPKRNRLGDDITSYVRPSFVDITGQENGFIGSLIGYPPEPELRSDDNSLPEFINHSLSISSDNALIGYPPEPEINAPAPDVRGRGIPLEFINGKWVEIEADTEDGFIGMEVGPVGDEEDGFIGMEVGPVGDEEDGFIGMEVGPVGDEEDGFIGMEVGPVGLDTGSIGKRVPLKFIGGKWVEDTPHGDRDYKD